MDSKPERPTMDETLLAMTRMLSHRSTCSRAHVGAIIAKDGRALAPGYNGAPSGMPHCDHSCDCHPYETWTYVYSNVEPVSRLSAHSNTCRTQQPCKTAVHAEVNAIAFAAKHGVAVDGSTLYCTLTPCRTCAQLLINAGITRVVIENEYRNNAGKDLLNAAGIDVELLKFEYFGLTNEA